MRKETVEWIMKNSNVRKSPITRDTLLIADADSKVNRRVPNLLLECSMRQLHNELIAHQMMEVYLEPDMLKQMM